MNAIPRLNRAFNIAVGALLALLVALSFTDWPMEKWTWKLSWALLAAGVALDWPRRPLRRLLFTAAAFGAWAVVFYVSTQFSPDPEEGWVWRRWLNFYWAWQQWLLILWFAWPLLDRKSADRPIPTIRFMTAALLLLGGWQLAVAPAGYFPEMAISLFRLNMGKYLIAMIALMRLWSRGAMSIRWSVGALAAGAAVQVLLTCGMWLYAANADPATFEALRQGNYILQNNAAPHWRVVFPMEDFNRLGFGMLLDFYILGFACIHLGRRNGWFLIPLMGLAALGTLFTMTRGATGALAIGLLAPLAWRKPKWFAGIAVAGILAAAFLPSQRMDHFRTLFSRDYYTNPRSSIAQRARAWHAGVLMIADKPVAGIGYGPVNYYELYKAEYRERLGGVENQRHSHHQYLQFAIECGLPALALFLTFMLARWRRIFLAARRAPHHLEIWLILAFECSTVLFGQFFYMTKGVQGLLFWLLWIGAALRSLDIAHSTRQRSESTLETGNA